MAFRCWVFKCEFFTFFKKSMKLLMFANTFQVPEKRGYAPYPAVGGIHGRDESLSSQPCAYVELSPCLEPKNSINLDSIYSNFQPSLDHIDSKKKVRRVCMGGSPPPPWDPISPPTMVGSSGKQLRVYDLLGDHPGLPCWKVDITWDGSRWGKRAKQHGGV